MTDDELRLGRAAVVESAITEARRLATRRVARDLSGLVRALADGAEDAITESLTSRNFVEQPWLVSYEVPWALLVLTLLSGSIADLSAVVGDARDRGATVPQIAKALGIANQSVYATYGEQVVRRRRS